MKKKARRDPFLYAHEHAKDVVWMSQNTNQIPTTKEISSAISESAKAQEYNLYPYSKGLPELNSAIEKDLGADGYDILLTNGGIESLYALTRALLKRGDEVIATDPSFMPIHHQIQICGAVPVEIGVYRKPWKMTADWIIDHITKNTKMILLIDPHNPMGTEYSREEIKAISDIAEDYNLYVVDDVTYRDFAFHHSSTSEFIPGRTILVYTFSKNCGLAGLRIGGCLASPELMKRIEKYNTNVLSVNILAQRAALRALETKSKWIGKVLKTCRQNQKAIKDAVEKIDGCFLPVYPSSTNMFLIDVSATGIQPNEIQDKLLYEHKVFVRSGNYVSKKFGGKFIRVSFSVPKDGCTRFVQALPSVIEDLR
jgi:aspartate/methionine/tyrosine aminotransferase